jgi:PAS domain S-box-containing protein
MVQSNPQTPWIMDANGMNVEVSPRWEQITGMSPEQTRDDGWLAALPVEDVARISPLFRHCLRTGEPLDIEYRVRTKDGAWRWMRSRGKAQRGENEEIVRWYGSVEDIDNYKKVVEALLECEAKLRALEAN